MFSGDDRHWQIWAISAISIAVGTLSVLYFFEDLRPHGGGALWSIVLLSGASCGIAALLAKRPKLRRVCAVAGAVFGFIGALALLFIQDTVIAGSVVFAFTIIYASVRALLAAYDRIRGSRHWAAVVRKLSSRKLKAGVCTYCGRCQVLDNGLCEICHEWMMLWQ